MWRHGSGRHGEAMLLWIQCGSRVTREAGTPHAAANGGLSSHQPGRLHLLFLPSVSCYTPATKTTLVIVKIWEKFTTILSNLNNFHSLGSCGSRQRDTTSSGWKLQLNNLAVKELKRWNIETKEFLQLAIIMNVFPLYLNTNAVGLRQL